MPQLNKAYKLLIFSLLMLVFKPTEAQFVPKIMDYLPAPGQFTNADYLGTPSAANSLVGTNKGLVSLGAFGGSVTVYFSEGIKNDPANPYGVDFTIYGNPTSTWSEPGIIQVMKDENHNGIPDESWYEIAGSEHFWNSTISSYEVTYQNNGLNKAGDIHWADNQGSSGIIPENSFHQQPYYPKADLFPGVATDKYTLKGTRLTSPVDLSNPGQVISWPKTFGYADNTPVLSYSEKLPDNPYTPATEGSGGDAIDISWAVDQNKNQVKLDEIHFIRIYTGMNALAGWLGEVSTEITGIRDVEPSEVTGIQSVIVIQEFAGKMAVGLSQNLNAILFEKGLRQTDAGMVWSVSNAELAIVQNGKLTAKKTGTIQLRTASASNTDIYTEKTIEIYSASKAKITIQSNTLKINDKLELTGQVTDQNGSTLSGINTTWRIDDEQIAELSVLDGKYYLKGKQVGKSWLHYVVTDNRLVRDSVLMEVVPESAKKKVYISVKTSEKMIIPRQSVWVGQVDLTAKVDRNQKNYGLNEITFVSLAHAVAAVFKTAGLDSDWAFRDDAEGGSALYLWKVPSVEDGSTVYTFGYGGSKTSDAYRKTWVVMQNQTPVVTAFDKIKVNNDDEILIYHIADNNLPWTVTQLTSGADTVKINQNVDIQLKRYSCSMDANRNISVNSSEAIANQNIVVQENNASNAKINLTSDEFGKATLAVKETGSFLIYAGTDQSRLIAESITANKPLLNNTLQCIIYPNPFTESLKINCPSGIDGMDIFNAEGQVIFHRTGNQPEVKLNFLPSGIYFIRIESGNRIFRQKIVKK